MNAEKWEAMAGIREYTVSFRDASRADLKRSAYHFLEWHMERVVRVGDDRSGVTAAP